MLGLLAEAARRLRHHRAFLLTAYLVNAGFGLLLALSVFAVLNPLLSHSLRGQAQLQRMGIDAVVEILTELRNTPLTMGLPLLLLAFAGYWIWNLLWTANYLLAVRGETDGHPMSVGDRNRRLLRILQSAMVAVLGYLLVAAFCGGTMALWRKAQAQSMEAAPVVAGSVVALLASLLLFVFVNLWSDYAKVAAAAGESKPLRHAWRMLAHTRALRIYALQALVAMLFWLAYWGVSESMGTSSGLTVAIGFLARQLFMVSRMWSRMWFFTAESVYWDRVHSKAERGAELLAE